MKKFGLYIATSIIAFCSMSVNAAEISQTAIEFNLPSLAQDQPTTLKQFA